MKSSASCICRSRIRPRTSTAATVRANNLFGDSLVCVELKTGQRKWHYQIVHHPIWDYDMPAAPLLADIVVNGKPVKAVAQATKQGWGCYVFDSRDRAAGVADRREAGSADGRARRKDGNRPSRSRANHRPIRAMACSRAI